PPGFSYLTLKRATPRGLKIPSLLSPVLPRLLGFVWCTFPDLLEGLSVVPFPVRPEVVRLWLLRSEQTTRQSRRLIIAARYNWSKPLECLLNAFPFLIRTKDNGKQLSIRKQRNASFV